MQLQLFLIPLPCILALDLLSIYSLYRACGALKSVPSNRVLGIKAKKCLCEGVIVLTAFYRVEAWGMRSAERRKVNALEKKCLRSLVIVSRLDS